MEKGEAGQIEYSQLVGIRHNNAVWGRDSDFITKGGVLGKRESDGRRQVKSDKAQGGGEVEHLHDLKEWKVKDCDCQRMCVEQGKEQYLLSEGCLVTDSVEEGDLQGTLTSKRIG